MIISNPVSHSRCIQYDNIVAFFYFFGTRTLYEIDEKGDTHLNSASETGQLLVIQYRVEKGAD